MPNCMKCEKHVPSINALYLHLKIAHGSFQNEEVFNCNEHRCYFNCRGWKAFKRHLVGFHRCSINELLQPIDLDSSPCSVSNVVVEEENDHHAAESILEPSSAGEVQPISVEVLEQMVNGSVNTFLGKLYTSSKIPRSHVQRIFEDTSALVHEIVAVMKSIWTESLKTFQADADTLNLVSDTVAAVERSFASLSTEYKRFKSLTSTGSFIKPQAHVIGSVVSDKLKEGRMVKEIVPVTGQFIPLRMTLTKFFSLPGVFERVRKYADDLDKDWLVLSNFVQGSLWREKKQRFYFKKEVFPIFIYYDDFEVNNPLGTHNLIQKLGGTYFSIPCLPPEYQATVDNIFLALLIHSADRSNYSNRAVFRILVQEINHLQRNGIVIKLPNGDETTLYFALGLVLGDNLGLNQLLGFAGGFNANFYCRSCKTHKNIMQTDLKERPENLRTVDSYAQDVSRGMEQSGLSEDSIWNEVDNYHVYENRTADIGHDWEEGVLNYGMMEVLHRLVVRDLKNRIQLVPYNILNERVKTFNYSKHGISNPPPLPTYKEIEKKNLRMSATEMRNFHLIFSMLVGDLVDHNCEVWQYYLIMRRIGDILYAPHIQVECTKLLSCLIEEHHEMYQRLFKQKLKPKHHNMVHYPGIIQQSGPLKALNSMRYESNHREMKSIAEATTSRKNVSYTIAVREQLRMCYRFLSGRGLEHKLDLGPCTVLEDVSIFSDSCSLSTCVVPPEFRSSCVEVPWVDYKGTRYQIGTCVTIKVDSFGLPVFGEIDRILCTEGGKLCILCFEIMTLGLEENLHAYLVARTGVAGCYYLDDLLTHLPVILVHISNSMYVTVKHAL